MTTEDLLWHAFAVVAIGQAAFALMHNYYAYKIRSDINEMLKLDQQTKVKVATLELMVAALNSSVSDLTDKEPD